MGRQVGAWLGLGGMCAALVCLGALLRLEMLDSAVMSADSLSPYLKAVLVASGRRLLPQGPFPESGYIVAWTFLPYLEAASSLRGALTVRFVVNALMAIPLTLAIWQVMAGSMRQRVCVAGIAGSVAATYPGFSDTLLTGYQTFDAPLYATLPILGALRIAFGLTRGSAWLIFPVLPILGMLHPFAVVYGVGGALALVWLWRVGEARRALVPILIGLVIASPHLYRHLAPLLHGPQALLDHFWQVAGAPGHFESLSAVLLKAVREEMLDRELLAHGLLLLALPLSWISLPLLRRIQKAEQKQWVDGFQRWTLWATLIPASLVLMAAYVRYFQPYHLRLLVPVLAVSLAMWVGAWIQVLATTRSQKVTGMATLVPIVVCMGLAYQLSHKRFSAPPPGRESLLLHEAQAAKIRADAGNASIAMSFVFLSQELSGSPAAYMLDLWLSGFPEARLAHTREGLEQARIYLTLTGELPVLEIADAVRTEQHLALLEFNKVHRVMLLRAEGAEAVRQFAGALCARLPENTPVRAGAANDYLSVLTLDHDTTQVPGWFSACPAP